MACCRQNKQNALKQKVINKNTLCMKCSLDMKDMYYMSALQTLGGKTGSSTLLVRLSCPQCSTLNGYIVNIDKKTKTEDMVKK